MFNFKALFGEAQVGKAKQPLKDDFVIDMEEMSRYIASKYIIDPDTVSQILEAEIEYLKERGIAD